MSPKSWLSHLIYNCEYLNLCI